MQQQRAFIVTSGSEGGVTHVRSRLSSGHKRFVCMSDYISNSVLSGGANAWSTIACLQIVMSFYHCCR